MEAEWYAIKKEITNSMANSGLRIYVLIADIYGNTRVMDSQLEPYEDIIKRTIKINITFLGIGDYAIPLSSKNLMIFKISDKGIVILFANKGNIAQLLSFKKLIKYFGDQVDNLIGELEVPPEFAEAISRPVEKKVAIKLPKQILGKEMPDSYPIINRAVGDKIKATVDEIRILHLCDGQHTFLDILQLTEQPAEPIYDFLSKQIKKKVVRSDAHSLLLDCPDCGLKHPIFIPNDTFQSTEPPFKLLIRSDLCNHEYVVFLDKKNKIELQSFKYFTEFQKDKFMKKLGRHYYTILS